MKDKKGRAALNNRFVKAFNLLEERGDIIRNGHSKGLSAVAEQILGNKSNGHLINKYLSGERNITYEAAEEFCDYFGISKDFMFKGEGKVFVNEEDQGFSNSFSGINTLLQEGQILYSEVPALASSSLGIEQPENAEYFNIPGMRAGKYIAFTVSGNSMYPTLREGDMVICKSFENPERITDNEVYAVVSDLGVQVKRLQKIMINSKLQGFKMISDNYLEHDPFTLDFSQVRKILKVEKKITVL